MRRRDFMAAVGVGLLGATASASLPKPEPVPPLRKVERWDGTRWVRIRLKESRKGDRIRVEEVGECDVAEDPELRPDLPGGCMVAVNIAPRPEDYEQR